MIGGANVADSDEWAGYVRMSIIFRPRHEIELHILLGKISNYREAYTGVEVNLELP